MLGYYSRDEERTGHRAIRDTESIAASYDRYLRNGVLFCEYLVIYIFS